MRRWAIALLLVGAACGGEAAPPQAGPGSPSPTPVEVEAPLLVQHRTIREGQSSTYCVEGPEFAVAMTRDEWFAISQRHFGCQPLADPAEMLLDWDTEAGVAAWWKVEGCLGHTIETQSVVLSGDRMTIMARSTAPEGACATALGQLESFLAIPRGAIERAATIRFVLDGDEAGRIAL